MAVNYLTQFSYTPASLSASTIITSTVNTTQSSLPLQVSGTTYTTVTTGGIQGTTAPVVTTFTTNGTYTPSTAAPGCKYLIVKVQGGGGSGAGGGGYNGPAGTVGNNSSVVATGTGAVNIIAYGGGAGPGTPSNYTIVGTASVGGSVSGTLNGNGVNTLLSGGGAGQGGPTGDIVNKIGAYGGNSYFGIGGTATTNSQGATANPGTGYGSGGAGGGNNATQGYSPGSGGGGGGYYEAMLTTLASSYTITVGQSVTGSTNTGSPPGSGQIGGSGAAGVVLVIAYY